MISLINDNIQFSVFHCVNSMEFFWATFSRIRTEFGDLQSKYPYSFRMWEHADQKTPNTCTFYTMLPF